MDFPRFVYLKGSTDGQLVHDEAEYSAAIKGGYFPSVPEALAGKIDAPLEKPSGSRAQGLHPPKEAQEPKNAQETDTRSPYEILSSLPDEALFEEAKERGVSGDGSRKELIDRIYLAAGYSAEGIPAEME